MFSFFAHILLFLCSLCRIWIFTFFTLGSDFRYPRQVRCLCPTGCCSKWIGWFSFTNFETSSIQKESTNLSGGVSYVPVAWNLCPEILNSGCWILVWVRKLESRFGLEGSGMMHQQSHKHKHTSIFRSGLFIFTQSALKEPSSNAVNQIPSSCGGLICLFLNHSYWM